MAVVGAGFWQGEREGGDPPPRYCSEYKVGEAARGAVLSGFSRR
jgi:hypothetical protein